MRFSAARFKRLPMAEKLAYLRAAFGALGSGLEVVDRRNHAERPMQPAAESRPIRGSRNLPLIRVLSRTEFNRLTMDEKLEYLSRTHRDLREAARKWGRTPFSR